MSHFLSHIEGKKQPRVMNEHVIIDYVYVLTMWFPSPQINGHKIHWHRSADLHRDKQQRQIYWSAREL